MSKKRKKIGIIGHFAFGLHMTDGQTVKTLTFTRGLEKRFGEDEICKADTHGGAISLLKLPFQAFGMMRRADNIMIFPAQRGVRVIVPLLSFLNRFFHRRLHYCVIGGWLPALLKGKRLLQRGLKRFHGIYVETGVMRSAMAAMGFDNVFIVPNCKDLGITAKEDLKVIFGEPLQLCTFSRVMREKGIEDAVNAVADINSRYDKKVYALDIYGPVDPAQTEWFESVKSTFPPSVSYRGAVAYEQSAAILREYDALVFPTHFYTEGIPGTIIDAYAAGIPVIAARWESFSDIIREGETGIGYEFDHYDGLLNAMTFFYENRNTLGTMKENCIREACKYLPENALEALIQQIGA